MAESRGRVVDTQRKIMNSYRYLRVEEGVRIRKYVRDQERRERLEDGQLDMFEKDP